MLRNVAVINQQNGRREFSSAQVSSALLLELPIPEGFTMWLHLDKEEMGLPLTKTLEAQTELAPAQYQFKHLSFQEGLFAQHLLIQADLGWEGWETDESAAEFAVTCSYVEIYKEVVRDLLQPSPSSSAKPGAGLAIRESPERGVYVDGLAEVCVMSDADVLECLRCGNANRAVGATLMNAQSSRSHALLRLTVQRKLPNGAVNVAVLSVADLAGSEKVSKTGSTGQTLDEAKQINKSLSALCLVIGALSDGAAHVPYRNSKLTRVLQESLGGNSKTVLVVTCSPASDNAQETHSSLHFARSAKKVKNVAVINTIESAESLRVTNAALRAEVVAAEVEGGQHRIDL